MITRLWLAGLLVFCPASGQFPKGGIAGPCTDDQARGYSGVWVRQTDNLLELNQSGLSAAERAGLLAKADKAVAILRQAYPVPRGVDVWNSRWAMRPPGNAATHPIQLSAYLIFMQYRCYSAYRDTGQPRLVVEGNSDAWVMVDFNNLGQALKGELPDGYELPSGGWIYWSPIEAGPLIRGEPTLKGTIEPNTTTVFLGKGTRLPVRPVTKEEILRIHAAYWRKQRLEEAERHQKDIARDEKLLTQPRRPGASEEVWQRNQANYRERIELAARRLAKAKEESVSLPQRIQAQIDAMSPQQRQEQAMIDPINKHSYVDLAFGPGPNRRPLWALEENYSGKPAPRSAVHYMTVFWRRVPSMPSKEKAFDELLSKLDFSALRSLLDQ